MTTEVGVEVWEEEGGAVPPPQEDDLFEEVFLK